MLGAPPSFEFQSKKERPNPSPNRGQKSKAPTSKKSLALPSIIFSSSTPTALVQSRLRCSFRISSNLDGFCPIVKLDGNPTKKCKIIVIQIDEATEQEGPVQLAVLQGWGINCGVPPSELTEDALLQAPSIHVPNEDQANQRVDGAVKA